MHTIKVERYTNEFGVLYEEAEALYSDVYSLLFNRDKIVVLDFTDVKWISFDFLKMFIGSLLENVPTKIINTRFSIVNLPDSAKDVMEKAFYFCSKGR